MAIVYDSIIVGAGPTSILEGLHLKAQGKRVLLLEQHDVIGGAWRTVQHATLPPLEIGCHIWDIDNTAYGFLQNFLGISLEPMRPKPLIIAGSVRIPYARKNLVIAGKLAVSSLKKAKFGDFFSNAGKAMAHGASLTPKSYLYPTGGAAELMAGLERKIAETGLEIRTSALISQVTIGNDQVSIETQNDVLIAKELVLTTFSRIPKYRLPENKTLDFSNTSKRDFIHLHLVFDDDAVPNFSYIRLMQHPIIHRISDVTHQLNFADQKAEGKRIILVGVFEKPFAENSKEELIALIEKTLREYKLIGTKAALSWSGHNVYSTFYFGGEELDNLLEQGNEKLRILRSTNFIHTVAKQLDRWKTTLG
jgi:protoporphyrinogen oxidase